MTVISEAELNNIRGGGFGLWLAIVGLVTFVIGVIDGYVRPIKCNK